MDVCACGAAATANGRECPEHYRERLRGIGNHFTPTRGRSRHMGRSASKRWDRRLGRYAELRKQGIQPAGTGSRDIEIADRISQEIQEPFSARHPAA